MFKSDLTEIVSLAYLTGIFPIGRYDTESALNNFQDINMLTPQWPITKYFGFNENAKAELNALYNAAINAPKQKSKIAWDKAIISKKDLIFPPKAVQNYFRNCEPKCALKSINAPHFAFYNFTTWEQILAL